MTALPHLPALTLLPFAFLFSAVGATLLGAPNRIVAVLGALTVALAVAAGLVGWAGLLAVAVLWGATALFRGEGPVRWLGAAGILTVGYALGAHLVPGFHNPLLLEGILIGHSTAPYTLALGLDKGLAGLVLLGAVGVAPWAPRHLQPHLGLIAAVTLATVVVVTLLGLLGGFVRPDPKWTPLFWLWAPVNLFIACAAEEAFFRGFLQGLLNELWADTRHGAALAIAGSAALFGLAHLGGGAAYAAIATVAGVGYGWVCARSGRVLPSVLAHFAVNATHFILLTYPRAG